MAAGASFGRAGRGGRGYNGWVPTSPTPPTLLIPRPLRLVMLDLDDTIIDTDGAARERIDDAIGAARRVLGASVDEARLAHAHAAALACDPVSEGRPAVIFRELGITPDEAQAQAVRDAYNARLVELVELFEGALETLAVLRERYRTVIVTNGPAWLQRAKLDRFDLARHVDHIVVSGELGVHKPDAAIFHHACARVGVTPREAVHVGDSLVTDVGGAIGAGCAAVWLRPSGYRVLPDDPAIPDATISHITELRGLCGTREVAR